MGVVLVIPTGSPSLGTEAHANRMLTRRVAWHLGLPWSPDKDIKTGLKGLLARSREPGASPRSTELGDSAPTAPQKEDPGQRGDSSILHFNTVGEISTDECDGVGPAS